MEEYVRWNQPRDQLSFNYAAWKLSKSLLKSEDAFLRIGITHDNLLKRRRHSQRTQKREYVTTERCDELKVYSEECYHASKCKACTHEKKRVALVVRSGMLYVNMLLFVCLLACLFACLILFVCLLACLFVCLVFIFLLVCLCVCLCLSRLSSCVCV